MPFFMYATMPSSVAKAPKYLGRKCSPRNLRNAKRSNLPPVRKVSTWGRPSYSLIECGIPSPSAKAVYPAAQALLAVHVRPQSVARRRLVGRVRALIEVVDKRRDCLTELPPIDIGERPLLRPGNILRSPHCRW